MMPYRTEWVADKLADGMVTLQKKNVEPLILELLQEALDELEIMSEECDILTSEIEELNEDLLEVTSDLADLQHDKAIYTYEYVEVRSLHTSTVDPNSKTNNPLICASCQIPWPCTTAETLDLPY